MFIIPCPECMGTTITCYICNENEKDDSDYIPCYDFLPCEKCNGRGYIEVEHNANT